ncbi:MAG: hypothetical protein FWG65_10300 [Turicibacter sp.]|nr:hypothetical protein [Turicibacter sp.]
MLNLDTRKYIECTTEEKAICVPVIDEVFRLANFARLEGVLALEEEGKKSENRLLQAGIRLVVDGTDPDLVRSILETYVITSGKVGAELLSQLIVCSGVLSLQQGENPTIILEKMFAFLGEEYMDVLTEKLDFYHKEHIETVGQIAMNMPTFPIDNDFEDLLKLENRDVQIILKEVDSGTLALALKGASLALRQHILGNFSNRAASEVLMRMDGMRPVPLEDVAAAQDGILRIIERLEEAGYVIRC